MKNILKILRFFLIGSPEAASFFIQSQEITDIMA